MYRFASLFLCVLMFSHHISALNILAIVSLPLHSHYMAFGKLFRELAIRGHSVTVFNNFPEENPPVNLSFVHMKQYRNNANYVTPLELYEDFDSSYWHYYNYYRHFEHNGAMTRDDCENFFINENAKAHYAKAIKYDLIFVEQFMADCGLAYALALYEAPIIGITSHALLPWAYSRLGMPFDISTDQFYFSKEGSNPPLYTKIENLFLNSFFNTIGRWFHQRNIYDVFNQYVPNKLLDIERATKERMKMMFVYQHFSVSGAHLLAPQVLEIAGMHITKPKPVPEAIETFLSNAKEGAIYVSFGSNLRASTMSMKKRQQFLNAFKSIPQKVIWKYENASFVQENLYTDNWLPQLDILCHPKVLAFVTHGGMLSLSEAAYCAKPVLVVPFFGDQFTNAAAARSVGLGRVLYFDRLDAESLARGINELTSQEMQQNAKRISSQWHDRPLPVMDSAIYWTEYVARHGTSPPPLPGQRTTWFQWLLLDVAVAIIGLLLGIALVVYVIFKFLIVLVKSVSNLLCKRKSKTE